MKKFAALLLAGGMLVGVLGPAGAAKSTKLWTDNAGDAAAADNAVPGLDQAGFDLVEGSITKNKSNLDFTVTHAAMPPVGAIPEGFRFLWAFAVDGESYRVTVKSVEVGKPNPADQSNTDQIGKVYPTGFFRLEGNCGVQNSVSSVSLIGCDTIAYLEGAFDSASKSFTFSVPMKDVKAKTGSKLTTGAGDASTLCSGAAACWISHAAERSSDRTVIDSALWTSTYTVPKK